MAKVSDFGKEIKIRLIEIGKTQNWLIEQIKTRTGLYFDDGYLYKVLTGKNKNPKIVEAIKQILEMEE